MGAAGETVRREGGVGVGLGVVGFGVVLARLIVGVGWVGRGVCGGGVGRLPWGWVGSGGSLGAAAGVCVRFRTCECENRRVLISEVRVWEVAGADFACLGAKKAGRHRSSARIVAAERRALVMGRSGQFIVMPGLDLGTFVSTDR